jgi:hypothetical protein
MSVTTRMLPANGAGTTTGFAGAQFDPNRRGYSAVGGGFIDASGPPDSGDASTLSSQGWLVAMMSGTTSARQAGTPSGFFKAGTLFLDTGLSVVLLLDAGGVWRNVITGAAVV